MKRFNYILILTSFVLLLSSIVVAQKASFVNEIEVDNITYIIWHGYVIDSTWLNVWLPNGDLPRRENGTYKYWKADSSGNLIPIRKIDYRLPIFQEQPIVMKREKGIFE